MGIRLSYVRSNGEVTYPLGGLSLALIAAAVVYGGLGLWLLS